MTIHKSLVYNDFLHLPVKFAFPCPALTIEVKKTSSSKGFLSSLYGLGVHTSPRQPLIYGLKANIPNDAEEASRILHQLEILSSIYYEGIIDP